MVDLDELATRAVADPVSPPRPMADLADRVRQRRRRRRRVAGGLAAAVIVGGAAIGARAWILTGDGSTDVVTEGPDEDGLHGLGSGNVVWPGGDPGWTMDELLDAVTTELLNWPSDTEWHTGPDGSVSFASTSTEDTGDPEVPDRWVEMTIDFVDGSWRIIGDPDLNYDVMVTEREGQASLVDPLQTPAGAKTVEVRWFDRARGEQRLHVDVEVAVEDPPDDVEIFEDLPDEVQRPVGLPDTKLSDLGSVLVIPRSADGQAITLLFAAFDDPSRAAAAPDDLPDAAFAESPCSLVLEGDDPDVNELEWAGLPDSVPEFLVEQFEIGSVNCLARSDNGDDLFVEGVYVGFLSGDDEVARWLISSGPTDAGFPGPGYLASLPGGGDVELLGDGFISILPSEHESAIRSQIAQLGESDYVSLWSELVAQR